jgi:hypothetical protein
MTSLKLEVKATLMALGRTAIGIGRDFLTAIVSPNIQQSIHLSVFPTTPPSRLYSSRWYLGGTIDGATFGEPSLRPAWAKYAIPKGLPKQGERPTMAIENDPHEITDFSGEIPEGYGKGTKTLLSSQTVIVKLGSKTFPAKMNYHVHDAERAGIHNDLVVEGIKPGTGQWEMNIPSGPYKGRYAFIDTPKGNKIIVPMKDEAIILPKPTLRMKPTEWLKTIDPSEYVFEVKWDGSVGNCVITKNQRAVFRSHRETKNDYYDKLPQLEDLNNYSRLWTSRRLFPGPDHEKSVIVGELFHPDGPGRMGGILNAAADKSRQIQELKGKATFIVWDIAKYKGRDVSKLPYEQRRQMAEEVVSDIRLFNPNWSLVEAMPEGGDPTAFYNSVTSGKNFWEGEGIVVKAKNSVMGDTWIKVKASEPVDMPVVEVLEGTGKYFNSTGKLVVENSTTHERGEVGSFAISDQERQWIWQNRDECIGAVAKLKTHGLSPGRGVPRAGVFLGWHEAKGNESALRMYAETLAGGDPKLAKETVYKLKASRGWTRKT